MEYLIYIYQAHLFLLQKEADVLVELGLRGRSDVWFPVDLAESSEQCLVLRTDSRIFQTKIAREQSIGLVVADGHVEER